MKRRLAQLVEHQLNKLEVVGSTSMLFLLIFLKGEDPYERIKIDKSRLQNGKKTEAGIAYSLDIPIGHRSNGNGGPGRKIHT